MVSCGIPAATPILGRLTARRPPRIRLAVLVALLAVAWAATGCSGDGGSSRGQDLYDAYRNAQDQRNAAEDRLRQAFADISTAAQREDRAGVVAAAKRGQQAAADIGRLLSAELEAAKGLEGVEGLAVDAKKLTGGLEQSRQSLALVSRELQIAVEDPLLAKRRGEVGRLARKSTDLAVAGELAVRKADAAITAALGLEPRPGLVTTTG